MTAKYTSRISLFCALICSILFIQTANAQVDSIALRTFGLEAVVVTATLTPKPISKSPVVTRVITSKQIDDRGVSDIKALLSQEIPGLTFNEVGFGTNINFQGLGGRHLLFLVDGERLAGETGNNIDYDRLSLGNIERIEIVEGASSALYGSQAMGAVINIITKTPKRGFDLKVSGKYSPLNQRNFTNVGDDDFQKVFKKNADHPNINGDILLNIKRNKFSSSTSIALKSTDAYQIFDRDSTTKYFPKYDLTIHEPLSKVPFSMSGIFSVNATQQLTYKFNNKWNIWAKGNFYKLDRFDLTPDNKYEQSIDLNATARATYKPDSLSDFTLSLYADRYNSFVKYEKLENEKDLFYRNQFFQPRAIYNYRAIENHTLTAGAEFINELLYSDKFQTGKYEFKSKQSGNIFVQDDWQALKNISIVAGLRADYSSNHGFNLSPKIAAMYKIYPFTLRLNYAMGYRTPDLKELYMNWDHLGMFWIYGNSKLKAERNNYLSFSGEYLSRKFYILATGYLNYFTDKIEGVWKNDNKEIHYQNISGFSIAGLSLNAQYKPIKQLLINLSGHYLHKFYKGSANVSSTPPLSANARVEYSFKIGDATTTINLTGNYVGKKTFDALDEIEVGNETVEAYYKAYVNPYSVWNFTITEQLWKNRLRITAGVENIFNYQAKIISFNSYTGIGRKPFIMLSVNI